MSRVEVFLRDLGGIKIAGLVMLLIIISGFLGAIYVNLGNGRGCTLSGCRCVNVSSGDSPESLQTEPLTGELECNSCYENKYLFHLGVIQVEKDCDQTQVYVCEAGEKVDEYYRDESCDYNFKVLT